MGWAFLITYKLSSVAYQVELPLGWRLDPIFHIDNPKRYIHSEEFLREVQSPPPMVVEDHLEYKVEPSSNIESRVLAGNIWYFGKVSIS